MGLFNCGRFYHVTNLSDSSDQLVVLGSLLLEKKICAFFENL